MTESLMNNYPFHYKCGCIFWRCRQQVPLTHMKNVKTVHKPLINIHVSTEWNSYNCTKQRRLISATCHQHAESDRRTGVAPHHDRISAVLWIALNLHSYLFTDPSLIGHELFVELPYIMKKMTYCEYICTLYLKLPTNNISCLFSTSYACADENIILIGCKLFIKYTVYLGNRELETRFSETIVQFPMVPRGCLLFLPVI
jgi:hypothetical protein